MNATLAQPVLGVMRRADLTIDDVGEASRQESDPQSPALRGIDGQTEAGP
jgi:hypothetical protein